MMVNSGITDMVAQAGRAFIAAKGKDPAIEGAGLAAWLRSGAEIMPGDRELLAELVTGEWRRSTGAPLKGIGSAEIREILADYHEREEGYGARQKKKAKSETAEKFGIKPRRLEDYLKGERERAAAVERAKSAEK